MTRTIEDFRPVVTDAYLLRLSKAQLVVLLGSEIAATVGDHFCRLSPQDEAILDLWLSAVGETTYERNPVSLPSGWQPYTIEAVYPDNNQEYTQSVLAQDATDAERVVQIVCYESNLDETPDFDGDDVEYLDIVSVYPGVH